jgi:SagB-type dehydrogenase family enzyme
MKVLLISFMVMLSFTSFAQNNSDIQLPEARKTGGKPLLDALNDRRTIREFSDKEFSLQEISDLLWAAYGVNRPEEKRRTAPSARNVQEFDIYVLLKSGTYKYDAFENKLIFVTDENLIPIAGMQDFVAKAPLILIYVADFSKYSDKMDEQARNVYAGIDCGYISQNVYLYAASENLATVVLGSVHKDKLKDALKLKEDQKVILGQPVGFQKK